MTHSARNNGKHPKTRLIVLVIFDITKILIIQVLLDKSGHDWRLKILFKSRAVQKNITSWWFQPLWKILVKLDQLKYMWSHHLDKMAHRKVTWSSKKTCSFPGTSRRWIQEWSFFHWIKGDIQWYSNLEARSIPGQQVRTAIWFLKRQTIFYGWNTSQHTSEIWMQVIFAAERFFPTKKLLQKGALKQHSATTPCLFHHLGAN